MQMKAPFILALLFQSFISYGQSRVPTDIGPNAFLADMNGRPLFLQENYIAEGSPYFRDQYYFAEVTMVNGKVYSDVQVKLNILENLVIYLTEDKKEMISTSAMRLILCRSSVK